MADRPTLTTARLVLRPFALSDACEVQRLAGDRSVADTTLRIPHPYEDGVAEEWIATHAPRFEALTEVNFAITLRTCGELGGTTSLMIERGADAAELGYWIGAAHRSEGYCTEAGHAVLAYGFESLNLNKICSNHFTRNPASGRVMQKLGMQMEGRQAQHVKKWDRYEDIVLYGLLRGIAP